MISSVMMWTLTMLKSSRMARRKTPAWVTTLIPLNVCNQFGLNYGHSITLAYEWFNIHFGLQGFISVEHKNNTNTYNCDITKCTILIHSLYK